MPHDNVRACEDVFGKLQENHMMSPTLIQINRTSPWSPCSAAIITEFLDSGHGEDVNLKYLKMFIDFSRKVSGFDFISEYYNAFH